MTYEAELELDVGALKTSTLGRSGRSRIIAKPRQVLHAVATAPTQTRLQISTAFVAYSAEDSSFH